MNDILLGLSGGIDSAVSALILKEQGFNPTGCFLMLTENTDENSTEAKNAEITADFLGIRLIKADFRERFRKNVTDYFIKEYLSGKTPNPCVMCNPTVKIQTLIEVAEEYGIEKIATGHYAKTVFSEEFGGMVIKAADSKKDQSYFLSRLSPSQIEKIIFPLGDFSSKEDVRSRAESFSLPNAKKPDSQEICFIPDGNYAKFISDNTDYIPGKGRFIDIYGNTIGEHSGIINYTVGQRKGLGAFGEPRYVKEINALTNTITLCKKDERMADTLTAEGISRAVRNFPEGTFEADVKIRSTAKAVPAEITVTGDSLRVTFSEKVIAPTPGQTAAIYKDNIVLGSAFITGK